MGHIILFLLIPPVAFFAIYFYLSEKYKFGFRNATVVAAGVFIGTVVCTYFSFALSFSHSGGILQELAVLLVFAPLVGGALMLKILGKLQPLP